MFEADIKETPPMTVAYLKMSGAYDQMPDGFSRLYEWVEEYEHTPSEMPMAVFHTPPSPTGDAENQWELWAPIEGGEIQFGPDERALGVKQVEPALVASTVHVGPYEAVEAAYRQLENWVVEQGYEMCGAPREVYYNSPGKVSPDEYRTEIQVPVKKR